MIGLLLYGVRCNECRDLGQQGDGKKHFKPLYNWEAQLVVGGIQISLAPI
jgi:hypothetical protein